MWHTRHPGSIPSIGHPKTNHKSTINNDQPHVYPKWNPVSGHPVSSYPRTTRQAINRNHNQHQPTITSHRCCMPIHRSWSTITGGLKWPITWKSKSFIINCHFPVIVYCLTKFVSASSSNIRRRRYCCHSSLVSTNKQPQLRFSQYQASWNSVASRATNYNDLPIIWLLITRFAI